MPKSLNELSADLRDLIISIHSDVRDKHTFRPEKYHNLKITMDVGNDNFPQIKVSMGISEATFDIQTGQKLYGSLGLEEKHIQRWFMKSETIPNLMACWNERVKNAKRDLDN